MRGTTILHALWFALLTAAPVTAPGADAGRGRELYEQRCGGCHAESVHGRAHRVASDFEAVRSWVRRWNATLKLGWGAEEVDDVAVYLNASYYRYACPPAVCPALTAADGATRLR